MTPSRAAATAICSPGAPCETDGAAGADAAPGRGLRRLLPAAVLEHLPCGGGFERGAARCPAERTGRRPGSASASGRPAASAWTCASRPARTTIARAPAWARRGRASSPSRSPEARRGHRLLLRRPRPRRSARPDLPPPAAAAPTARAASSIRARSAGPTARWRGRRAGRLLIYELHVGTFTPEGTFDARPSGCRTWSSSGVTAVEIMPVAEFPGARNWGYDGVNLFAPQSSYGGPDGLKRLVDACHRHGLAVILDVVYNHLGPDGNYLGRVRALLHAAATARRGARRSTSTAPTASRVRRYFIDNALYWLTELHVDALRLDAIHGIFDLGALHTARRDEARGRRPNGGRRLGRPWPHRRERPQRSAHRRARAPRGRLRARRPVERRLPPRGVHACSRGGAPPARARGFTGYFADFGRLDDLRQALAEGFVYDGGHSHHRRRRHGRIVGGACRSQAGDLHPEPRPDRQRRARRRLAQLASAGARTRSPPRCCSARPTSRCSSWGRSRARRRRSSTSPATPTPRWARPSARPARRSSRIRRPAAGGRVGRSSSGGDLPALAHRLVLPGRAAHRAALRAPPRSHRAPPANAGAVQRTQGSDRASAAK